MSRILFFQLSPRILASAVLASGLTVSEDKKPTTTQKKQQQQPLTKTSGNNNQRLVTLLSFAKDGSINFNVTGINSILDRVKDLPLVVYSINGKSQTGKSYLLSHLVRFLNYEVNPSLPHPNESSQWFTTDPAELAKFSWTSNDNTVTKGIQMWSEPFIVTRNGKEVAVILLDCQGLYDKSWEGLEKFQNFILMAICQIMSSVSILNVKKEVDDGILREIGSSSIYSRLHYKKEFDVDQHLIFLIRDWTDPEKFVFGRHEKDAPKITAETLADPTRYMINPTNYYSQFFNLGVLELEKSRFRLKIQISFENICMYLMPDPGDKFRDDPSRSPPSEDFQSHLKKFIHFLNSDQIANPKKALGDFLTGSSMKRFVEAMATMFTRYDDLPVVKDYYDCLLECQAMSLVMEGVEEAAENWKMENPSVSEETMNEFLSTTESEAKERLKKFIVAKKKKAREAMEQKYLEDFDKWFEPFSERFKTQNIKKQQ